MEDMFNNYRMIDEVKERAIERGSGRTEFESYDRVAKIERRRIPWLSRLNKIMLDFNHLSWYT